MVDTATRSLLRHEYVVCVTLIRSIFETNLFLMHLHRNPADVEDFVAFSELIGNVDLDLQAAGFSRTKRETLERKFSIRKMIRDQYAGTEDAANRVRSEAAYQQMCNATHPSLEPVPLFFQHGAPPTRAYSSQGIRRTLLMLWSEMNKAVEHVIGVIYDSDQTLAQACYARRYEQLRCHTEATEWHKENAGALPSYWSNYDLTIRWTDGRPTII